MGITTDFSNLSFRTTEENPKIKMEEILEKIEIMTPGAYVGVMLPVSTNVEDDILLVLREDYRCLYRNGNSIVWGDSSCGIARSLMKEIEAAARKGFDWSNWT